MIPRGDDTNRGYLGDDTQRRRAAPALSLLARRKGTCQCGTSAAARQAFAKRIGKPFVKPFVKLSVKPFGKPFVKTYSYI